VRFVRHLQGEQQEIASVDEAPTIISTCINCIAPGSLSATLAVILVGAGIALTVEQRKLSALSPRSKVRLGPPNAARTAT
jgi:hypothetical protein